MKLFNRAIFLAEKRPISLLSGLEEFPRIPNQKLVLNSEELSGINAPNKFLKVPLGKSEKGGEMNTGFKSKFSKIHFSNDPSVFDI
jgi:hypothetical protein